MTGAHRPATERLGASKAFAGSGTRRPSRHPAPSLVLFLLMGWIFCGPASKAAPRLAEEPAAAARPAATSAGSCPDLMGQWHSAVFRPLKVFADSSHETQAPTSMTLEVVYQEGCRFQAVSGVNARRGDGFVRKRSGRTGARRRFAGARLGSAFDG